MYRDLAQIHTSADEPAIPADATRKFGPYTLFNTRAFLIQLKATQVPDETELKVYLSTDFKPGDSSCPVAPDINDDSAWVEIHKNDAMEVAEPLVYEKCQTAAEWLRFDVVVGSGSTLNDLDIVLAKQAWR